MTAARADSLTDALPVDDQRRTKSWLKKSAAAALAFSVAWMPASDTHAQTSQQDYLRRQAQALKEQMIRAEVEQAASPGFAAEAYAAQQAYLRDTAEKSFRMNKPSTRNAQFIGHAEVQTASPAMPPVHVTPGQHAIAPRPRRIERPVPAVSPRSEQQTTVQVPDLPTPADIGYQGQSYAGPGNTVPLQDRVSSLLEKPKRSVQYRESLPSPKFPADRRSALAIETSTSQSVVNLPPPREFTREHRAPTLAPPRNIKDEARIQRMPSAIETREADLRLPEASAPSIAAESATIAQVGLNQPVNEPPTQNLARSAPPQTGFDERLPSYTGNAIRQQRVPASQVSVLNKASKFRQQEDDNSFGLPSPAAQEPSKQFPPRESLDAPNSLRPNQGTQGRRQEIDDLERKILELENQEPDVDTQRRQSELEAEQNRPIRQDNRIDANEDLRSDEDLSDRPVRRSCDEYRRDLLGRSIREISLDVSPGASRVRDQYVAISRSWTDRLGNIVATGTMVDLRRGYVIVDSSKGQIKIPYAKLSDADWAAISEYWQIPTVCSIGDSRLPNRQWIPQTFTWTASALCHKPLYFENRQLERYGHSHGPILQPIHSTAHFFVSLATLPYATAIHPPTECRYALGYYRPGNCAPWLKDPLPISLNGLKRQALITTGLGLLP